MKDKHFEAGNLYLATYLLYCGFAMKGIEGLGRLKRILFENIPAVHKACAVSTSNRAGKKGCLWQEVDT